MSNMALHKGSDATVISGLIWAKELTLGGNTSPVSCCCAAVKIQETSHLLACIHLSSYAGTIRQSARSCLPGDQRQGTLVPFTILCLSNICMNTCRWQTRDDDLLAKQTDFTKPNWRQTPHLQVFHPSKLVKPWLKVLLEALLQRTENAGTCASPGSGLMHLVTAP